MKRDKGRVGALDGIRGLAVLGVFGAHSGYPLVKQGWIGVDMFFVLSGFLITTLLIAEWESTGEISLRRFYMRRILRLYPALIAALAIAAPLYIWLGESPADYVGHAGVSALYLQDFATGLLDNHGPYNHTWTLAIEEQFYLLWPLLLILILRRGRHLWRALAVCTSLGVVSLLAYTGIRHADGWYWLPWTYAPVLLTGCLTAVVVRRHPLRSGGTATAAAGLLGLVGIAASVSFWARHHHLAAVLALVALATAMSIYGVQSAPDGLVSRVLSWRPLVGIGLISYAFYLIHTSAIVLAEHFGLRRSPTIVLALVLTVALSTLSYHYVERPFLRLKKRWESPGESGALTASQPLVQQS